MDYIKLISKVNHIRQVSRINQLSDTIIIKVVCSIIAASYGDYSIDTIPDNLIIENLNMQLMEIKRKAKQCIFNLVDGMRKMDNMKNDVDMKNVDIMKNVVDDVTSAEFLYNHLTLKQKQDLCEDSISDYIQQVPHFYWDEILKVDTVRQVQKLLDNKVYLFWGKSRVV